MNIVIIRYNLTLLKKQQNLYIYTHTLLMLLSLEFFVNYIFPKICSYF